MRRTLFLFCFAALLAPRTLPAEEAPGTEEDRAFKELSVGEFANLEQADQIDYLKQAVLNFRRQTSNISATTKMQNRNLEYNPKTRKTGSRVLLAKTPEVTELRRIGNSYRIWQHRDVEGNETPPAYPDVIDSYHSERRERRTLLTELKTGRPAKHTGYVFAGRDGLISSKADSNFFYQYLGDDHYLRLDYWDPGGQLLEHIDDVEVAEIDESRALVKVVFSYSRPAGSGQMRTVTQTYDLRNGGIPVEELIVEQAGRVVKFSHHLRVSDLVQTGGVWIPTTFRLTAWSNSQPRDQATVWTGTVSNIELGKLKPEDLQLTFPEGTKVSDYVAGGSYHVGENGVKIQIVAPRKRAATRVVP